MATQFVTGISTEEDGFKAGQAAAQQAQQKLKEASEPHLAVLFCAAHYDYAAVIRGVKSVVGEKVPLVGCTAAGQFTETDVVQSGVACAFIVSDTHLFFPGIGTLLKNDPIEAIQNATKSLPKEVEGYPHHSAILLIDGLVGKGEETVLAAASILGPNVSFAGGAAADSLNFKETYVFSNDQTSADAVSLCLIASRSPIIITVKHGHQPISPPLKVTKAKDNILYELEGRPALDVWKDFLRDRFKAKGIDIDKLSDLEISTKVLLQHEAGLMTGTDEYKIRFPASCNPDGSFNFVCSILEGSVMKIMDSKVGDQIESARHAAELAIQATQGKKMAGALIFDCVCRAMILQDQFKKAIQAGHDALGDLPFIGFETYGEIAMEKGQFSGFHNTTTVIMLFPY